MKPMNKNVKGTLDVLWYFFLFYIIQFVAMMGVCFAEVLSEPGGSFGERLERMNAISQHLDGNMLVLVMVISSLLTIVIYGFRHYSPFSNSYIQSRPWGVLFWAAVMSLGTILPSEWLLELLEVQMPESVEALFEEVMGKPWGYLVIGLLGPVAEEMVFRGAVLRRLLNMMPRSRHWWAIILSALLFGIAHGNVPQGIHGFIIGLLLGWMYYRTDSIVPGIVFHWINNTVAFVMFNIMPQMNDGKLIDLFHGDRSVMVGGILFSICIFLPCLFQLYQRMKPADKKDTQV